MKTINVLLVSVLVLLGCSTSGQKAKPTGVKEVGATREGVAVQHPVTETTKKEGNQKNAEKPPPSSHESPPVNRGERQAQTAKPPPDSVRRRDIENPSPNTPSQEMPPSTNDDVAKQDLRISLWIEILNQDATGGSRVSSQRVFHSGERVRFHFAGSVAGYISILLVDASGASTLLYPDAAKGQVENFLPATVDRVIPVPPAWLRFDQVTGVERLLVMFARDPAKLRSLSEGAAIGALISEMSRSAKGSGAKGIGIGNTGLGDQSEGDAIVATSQAGDAAIFWVSLKHEG